MFAHLPLNPIIRCNEYKNIACADERGYVWTIADVIIYWYVKYWNKEYELDMSHKNYIRQGFDCISSIWVKISTIKVYFLFKLFPNTVLYVLSIHINTSHQYIINHELKFSIVFISTPTSLINVCGLWRNTTDVHI